MLPTRKHTSYIYVHRGHLLQKSNVQMMNVVRTNCFDILEVFA